MSNNNYHQITVMERFDQSKMSFNCYPHCCSNISYSMVWQAIFNLNIPYNLTLYALAHSWTSFEKSDSFWINSDKFHGNRGPFKNIHDLVNTYLPINVKKSQKISAGLVQNLETSKKKDLLNWQMYYLCKWKM